MRNLKRALSLLLSSTMVLGMVVMGGSAAGYQDVDASNDNQEAIEVLQAVGIMSGVDDKGNFNPDGSLTRNEMAVVMAHLLNLDYDYYRGVNTFTDVPEWAAPYVAACVAEGVTAGIGNGLYGGDQKITAAQAGLMVMKALGYFQNQEDFGGDWQVATIRQASYINLFDKVNSNAETALTRGQVAQLVLNGLKAKMVDFTGDKGIQIGDVTVGYKAEYTPKANAAEKYNTIDDGTTNINKDDQYYVQLGEELYNGDLKLQGSFDDFNRPARYWEYKGNKIGTYVKNELIRQEYTTEVTGKDLYDLLGSNTVDTYEFHVSIDGVNDHSYNSNVFDETSINRNNKKAVGATGNGVLTQVFVDSNAKRVDISIINTYLAKATADYNNKTGSVSLNVYDLENAGNSSTPVYVKTANTDANKSVDNKVLMKASDEDFDVAGMVENDFRLVTVANGKIQTMAVPNVVSEATLTSFTVGEKVEADGKTYNYASTAEYDFEVLDNWTSVGGAVNLKDQSYNVYLDQYGYLIGIDLVEAASNYLFLTGIDANNSNLSAVSADAYALFLDGTSKSIKVNLDKSTLTQSLAREDNESILNTWCTYTVNNEGVYTVKEVDTAINVANKVKVAQWNDSTIGNQAGANRDIDVKHVYLPGAASGTYSSVYGNDNTVYLTAKLSAIVADDNGANTESVIISGVQGVTTGVKNANLSSYNEANVMALKSPSEDATWAAAAVGDVSYGVYTLYKSNGYIIGSVVVGKDEAASKNLVFINSSDVKTEGYDKAKDEWTWKRTATQNGQQIELMERGDSLTYLNNLSQYNWYQVQLDADGYVIGYSTAASALGTSTGTAPTVYVTTIGNVPVALNTAGMETVLYQQSFTNEPKVPQLVGSVLYATTTSSTGFFVAEDVNIVLIQKNDLKTTTTYETGVGNLENILATLNAAKDDSCYDYTISAVIEGGAAKTVIIQDTINDPTGNPGTTPSTPVTSSNTRVDTRISGAVKVYTTEATMSKEAARDALLAQLAAEGWNVGTVTETTPGVYSVSARKAGQAYDTTFGLNTSSNVKTSAIKVTLNGTEILFASTDTIKTVLADQNIDNTGKHNVKFYDANTDSTTFKASSDTTTLASGDKLTTGYYEVQVGSSAPANSFVVDLSKLELNTGKYYALGTATFNKGSTATTGSGIIVDTNKYLPYGSTYAEIAKNDGTDDAIANIVGVNAWLVAETDKSNVTTKYGIANGSAISTLSISNLSDGTYAKLNGTQTAIATVGTTTVTKDTTLETGYVQVGTLTQTSWPASGMTWTWNVAQGDFVRNGSTITLRIDIAAAAGVNASDTITFATKPAAVNSDNLIVDAGTHNYTSGTGVFEVSTSATGLAVGAIYAEYTVGAIDFTETATFAAVS